MYIFESERLGFRQWRQDDLDQFAAMNADPKVMEHFPNTLSREETQKLLDRAILSFQERNHTYFAVEIIATGEWIGFIGLAYQTYESDFTPAVDIGWRLKTSAWGKGFATEGAKRCLEYAKDIGINHVIATCLESNKPSENVMLKIGMTKLGEFEYPQVGNCYCYGIDT